MQALNWRKFACDPLISSIDVKNFWDENQSNERNDQYAKNLQSGSKEMGQKSILQGITQNINGYSHLCWKLSELNNRPC